MTPIRNAIHIIHPYQHNGSWVFDDERFGLSREPFMLGADKIVSYLGQAFGPKDGAFALVFSSNKLPESHAVFDRIGEWSREEGAWYQAREGSMRGWLCPALFNYFTEAPPTIYVRVEASERSA